MSLPSASSLQRSFACPGSTVLPRVETPSEMSEKGTALHEYLANVVTGMPQAEAIKRLPEEYRLDAEAIPLEKLPVLKDVKVELAFAYNYKTGKARILAENVGRDEAYAKADADEFVGTADIVGWRDGRLYVADYKTGSARHVTKASDNWQLMFLAVCSSLVFGVDEVDVGIIRTLDGVKYDDHTFDALDVGMSMEDLGKLARRIETMRAAPGGSTVVYKEGSHCGFCPSFNFCPAKMALLHKVSMSPSLTAEGIQAMLTPENAALAYARYRQVRDVLNKVHGALRGYAEHNPIKLPDGKMYGPVNRTREDIDAQVVSQVMKEKFPDERVIQKAFTLDTSKAAIKRAVREAKELGLMEGSMAAVERDILSAVAQRGGISTTSRVEYDEYKPGEE